ncbi:MAG: Ig-like domain-containing protein [Acidimicrobiales bacterium]
MRYRVTDADGLSDEAIVSVVVVANEAPSLAPVATSTPHDTPLVLSLAASASDPDGDELFFVCCENVTGGVAEVVRSAANTLDVRFIPSTGFTGTATFSYRADDRAGHLVAGSVRITVEPPDNRAPIAQPGSLEVEAGSVVPFDLSSLVDDPDGDPLRFSLQSNPLGATLSGGTVILQAPIDGAGTTHQLDVTATDPDGESVSSRLTITVTPVNAAPPRAIADHATTHQGAPVTIELLTNDVDPLGRGLTVVSVGAGPNGTSTLTDGAVVFTPQSSFFGTTSFTYTVRDAAGSADRESVGQVTVDVVGRPGTPTTPAANADNATATLVWTAPPANGAPIDAYRVEARSTNGVSSIDLGAQNSHTFSGLRNGIDYEFRLQAHNAAGWGEWSPWSLNVRPDTVPDQPATPTATFGNGELRVEWTPPANTGSPITVYQIEIGGGANQIISVGSSPYTWRGLTNGTSTSSAWRQ